MEAVIVRPKSALTTSYVSGYASPISDTGNTADTNQDFSSSGGTADRLMMARKFTATSSWYVGSVEGLVLGRTGSPGGSTKLRVLNDNGGVPDDIVGGDSDAVTCLSLSNAAGGAAQTFTWSDDWPLLVSGQDYWVAMVTSGYTYENGVTEVRWRTDANGAVAANECAKCIHGNVWTIIGTDVGANLTVKYRDQLVSMDDKNDLLLNVDFTIGSSSGADIKIETSDDKENWYEFSSKTITTTESTINTNPQEVIETCTRRITIEDINAPYVKLSVKALTDATSAQIGITTWRG